MRPTLETSMVVHGIAEKEGKILLVQEKNKSWSLPTGGVELDEDIVSAIIREVKEETGARCQPVGLFKITHGHVDGTSFQTSSDKVLRIHYYFIINILGDLQKGVTEHTIDTGWFSPQEMVSLTIRTKDLSKHINTYFEVKENNSFLKIDNIIIK
jgi:ADP-ribose pyrophosphatase YjhB (NUDIX family)